MLLLQAVVVHAGPIVHLSPYRLLALLQMPRHCQERDLQLLRRRQSLQQQEVLGANALPGLESALRPSRSITDA